MPRNAPNRRAAPKARGILRTPASPGSGAHQRILPEPALADYVAHFWCVRWALSKPELAETLPHPAVHLLFEDSPKGPGRAEIAGVPRTRFSRLLEGQGRVFGIKFRPAMFKPLLGADLSTLTGRVVPIASVFGKAGNALARAIFATDDLVQRVVLAEQFLRARIDAVSPRVASELKSLRDLVELMATSRSLLRVESAAELLEIDVRTLQRRFRRSVGVSPKWVILRYRLHEAAEQLRGARPPSLAALAADLGYADQAHFARDFTKLVGRSPAQFSAAEAQKGSRSAPRTARRTR